MGSEQILVARPRLVERMNLSVPGSLTLVCDPAAAASGRSLVLLGDLASARALVSAEPWLGRQRKTSAMMPRSRFS